VGEPERLLGDECLGCRVAFGEERPGCQPQMLEDVGEVTDDADLDLSVPGLGLDAVDLVSRPVDECSPGAVVGRVAAVCLVEDLSDGSVKG